MAPVGCLPWLDDSLKLGNLKAETPVIAELECKLL
jgi:hypothetical protein